MKMWCLNGMIHLLFCYACLSTGKGKVFFESKNFFNVLRWDPVEPDFPEQKVLYSVQYQRYGQKEDNVTHCQKISALSCDLTRETLSVHDVHYLAQVCTNGKSLGSTGRFRPLADTTFGPPVLQTRTSESTLSVNVTLPLGPNGVSIADIIAASKKGSSKIAFLYTLHLTHPEWAALVNRSTSNQFVIGLKKPGEYCGYVDYRPSYEWGRNRSEQAPFCVTLVRSSKSHQTQWILVGAAVFAGLIIMSTVGMCAYVKGGGPRSVPQALVAQQETQMVPPFPDENLIISEVKLISHSSTTVYATIRMKSSAPSAGSECYSPQDILCRAWPGDTGSSVDSSGDRATPNPAKSSGQSSEIYGAVAVHVPEEENGHFQMPTSEDSVTSHPALSNSKVSIQPVSHGTPTAGSGDSDPARRLVLQTLRDINGQLVLPSLTIQLQDNVGDTTSASPERKPLLSDLTHANDGESLASSQHFNASEWSDSGCEGSIFDSPTQPYCNSSYIATQPVGVYLQQGIQTRLPLDAVSETAYKPNWTHAIPHACATAESCEDTRTNSPWTEGSEEDEGSERTESSFALGKWTLHIQD